MQLKMLPRRGLSVSVVLCCLCLTNVRAWFLDPSSSSHIGNGLQFTEHDFDLTNSVSAGAHIGIAECAFQFQYEKWNCPEKSFYLHKIPPTKTTSNRIDEKSVQRGRGRTRRRRNRSSSGGGGSSNGGGNASSGSSSSFDNSLATSSSSKRPSNRETAFIHAITSAGITHTLTKNCSTGDFGDCGCDARLTKRQYGWKWGGCSDNFHFGNQVAREFLDGMETGSSPESMANLHNNEAGRVAVRKKMRRLCKCHGVSGSCTTQTCWSTISDFRLVGSFLKKMYNQALRVDFDAGNGQLDRADNLIRSHMVHSNTASSPSTLDNKLALLDNKLALPLRASRSSRSHDPKLQLQQQPQPSPEWLTTNADGPVATAAEGEAVGSGRLERYNSKIMAQQKEPGGKIKKRRLVFLQDSPNYCQGNEGGVEQSVLARTCVAEPGNIKSRATVKTCSKLCKDCGFKVVRREVEVLSSCNCRFQWCCQVTCETCKMKRIEITCSVD